MKKDRRILVFLVSAALLVTGVSASPRGEKIPEGETEKHVKETEELPEDCTPKRGNRSPIRREEGVLETAGGMGWYCRHTDGGARPPIPAEMSWLTSHNGYFLGADEPVIYLTFDAGYENGNVAKILDVLKEEEVPGAFFVLENLVTRNTDLVKRMAEEGHLVCNHTARHRDMTAMTREEFASELASMEEIYRSATGCEMAKYYRPPEGKLSEENLIWAEELGYKTIMWSFAYADWDNGKQPDPASAQAKVLAGTHNGEVLLLHPTSGTNAAILGDLIRTWKSMGYRFGTLDELTEAGDAR